MDHLNSSINNLPTREKFRLMSTVWFVLQTPIASLWKGMEAASWERLCATLFGYNESEIQFDQGDDGDGLMCYPTTYDSAGRRDNDFNGTMYGLLNKTKRNIPEPICRKFPSAYKSLLRRVVTRYNSVRKFPTSCLVGLPVSPFHAWST